MTFNELKEKLAQIEKEYDGIGLVEKSKTQTVEIIGLSYLEKRQDLIIKYLESEASKGDDNAT